jgi:hypothetical protein
MMPRLTRLVLWRALAFAALALLWPGIAAAAVIGPRDGWQPLRSGARALGISDRMVERILAAGVGMTCPGTVYKNGGALNGWFLGGDTGSFYTNAHGVIDLGADRRADFIEPLDKCVVQSWRDLSRQGVRAPAYALRLPANRHELALASFDPRRDSPTADRARLALAGRIAGAEALDLPDLAHLPIAIGEVLIMVSLAPPAMRQPVIQACHIRGVDLSGGGPGRLLSDCDNSFGNSAALYLVRDPASPGMLVPIALHEGCYEKLGAGKAWDRDRNTAVGILLRRGFFSFAHSRL